MKKITKLEKQGMLFLVIGIIVFAFLTEPISNWVSNSFQSDLVKLLIGAGLIIGIAYFGKLSKVTG